MSSKKKNKLKQEQNAQAVKGKQKSFLSSVKTNISKKDFSKEIKVLIVFGLFAVSGFFGFAFSGAPNTNPRKEFLIPPLVLNNKNIA